MKNISGVMRFLQIFFRYGRMPVIYGEYLEDRLYNLRVRISICPDLFWLGNLSTCEWPDCENAIKPPVSEYLRCCEFYGFGQVHLCLEIVVFL